MKATSGLVLIVFVGLVSCFNPPEYPSVPEIEFEQIAFVETPDLGDADTLNLSLHFKDGDGDIGLSDTDLQLNEVTKVYAEQYYFTTSGDRYAIQDIVQLSESKRSEDVQLYQSLLKYKLRKKAPYDTLPAFVKPYDCTNWYVINKTINNVNTPVDTVYFQLNPDHYNIFVDFLRLKNDGSGDFEEYDFRKISCTTYDGRIPVLAKEAGQKAPLQGIIHYSMISVGFKLTFSNTPIKLRIQIQDRALNKSNIITSDPFTLSSITK